MTSATEPPPSRPARRIHGAWYALTALPWLVAIAVLFVHVPRLIHGFASISKRAYAAGAHDIELESGPHTLYVAGTVVGKQAQPSGQLACTVTAPGGTPLPLERVTRTESLTTNGETFIAELDVAIPSSATYHVACESTPPALRFAVGATFPFLSILWCILALVLPLPAMGIIGYLVNRARNPKVARA